MADAAVGVEHFFAFCGIALLGIKTGSGKDERAGKQQTLLPIYSSMAPNGIVYKTANSKRR